MIKYKLLSTVLVSLAVTGACYAQTASSKPSLKGLDTVFNQILKDYHAAGFSVAVVHKDSLVYAKGFGLRDVEQKLPATPNTLYAIGSSTKAFTAALVGKLLTKDQSLDDKASTYLPGLHFKDGRESEVTIRDLMTHRTGLSRYDFSWYIFNTDNRDSLLQRIKYMDPTAPLREKWQYNNFMYLAQGMIAERITGKSWEENIKSTFFEPLSMHRSNLDVELLENDADAARGYTVDDKDSIIKVPYFQIRGMGPAGAINSNVLDMAHWLRLWIGGGKYEGKQIITSDYVAQAAGSQMVMSTGLPGKHPDIHLANYGLGWMIGSYRGHYQVEHGGNIDGFTASVCFFPSDELGIVVLANQNNSSVPAIVRNIITDRMLGLEPIKWNNRHQDSAKKEDKEEKQADLARVQGTHPSHQPTDYAGTYSNPAYGSFYVTATNDSLQVYIGKAHAWLSHYHYDVFELREIKDDGSVDTTAGGLKINFHIGQDGKIQGAAITLDDPSGNPVEFKKAFKAKEVSQEQLDKYVGKYKVGDLTITITVKDSILFMNVPGQTNYETVAQDDLNFKLKGLNGFSIRFEFDDDDAKASAVYSIQPNGTFKALRIEDNK